MSSIWSLSFLIVLLLLRLTTDVNSLEQAQNQQIRRRNEYQRQEQQQKLDDAVTLWTNSGITDYVMLVHRQCALALDDTTAIYGASNGESYVSKSTLCKNDSVNESSLSALPMSLFSSSSSSSSLPSVPLILQVHDGTLDEVIDGTTNEIVTLTEGTELVQFYTVDVLFDVIHHVLYELDDAVHYVDVSYDEGYGYPTSIYIDPSFQRIGDEFVVHVNSFAPLSIWQRDLDDAHSIWTDQQITSYTYVFRQYDDEDSINYEDGKEESSDSASPPYHVEVVNGVVVSSNAVVDVGTGQETSSYDPVASSAVTGRSSINNINGTDVVSSTNVPTIEEFFETIQAAIDDRVQKLNVEYHWTYGYPTYAVIDPTGWSSSLVLGQSQDEGGGEDVDPEMDKSSKTSFTATMLVVDNEESQSAVSNDQVDLNLDGSASNYDSNTGRGMVWTMITVAMMTVL